MTDYTKLTDSEIDRLVAERVMDNDIPDFITWNPTTDKNQAFEAMEKSKCHIDICFDSSSGSIEKWVVYGGGIVSPTDNPARAICIALLEAEGDEIK